LKDRHSTSEHVLMAFSAVCLLTKS